MSSADKCAFCYRVADSGEHIWSKWIGKRLPPTSYNVVKLNTETGTRYNYRRKHLDEKAPVVCTKCNNNWMSQMETLSKPVIDDMIFTGKPKLITESDARVIAAIAFKCTVVANHEHLNRNKKPFFTFAERRMFARSLTVPLGLQVWLAHRTSASRVTGVHKSSYGTHVHPRFGCDLYSYTFGIGYLLCQTFCARWNRTKAKRHMGTLLMRQDARWDNYAIPIWPSSAPVYWPPPSSIDDSTIDEFCDRFKSVNVPPWMVG